MGDEMHITYEMKSRVIERLWLRAWLSAMLCMTIGFGYLILGNPQVQDAAFLIFILTAFFLIGVAILYQVRHTRGEFGSTEDDKRFIFEWLEETNHWWGKPLFSTHFTTMQ